MARPCILVPAHNEAGTIAATLAALAPIGQDPAAGQLIVACNACTDQTAAIAAAAAPAAQVLSIAERGKVAALNAALAVAEPGAVIMIDADIVVSPDCIAALSQALDQDEVMAASPMPRFDLGQTSWPVRAFYRIYGRHPYLAHGIGGSGVIALCAKARGALGALPAITADDHYMRTFFPLSAQRRVSQSNAGRPVFAEVCPPFSLSALIETERRSRLGVREVHDWLNAEEPDGRVTMRWLLAVAVRHPIDCTVFIAVKLWAALTAHRFRHRGQYGWTTLRR